MKEIYESPEVLFILFVTDPIRAFLCFNVLLFDEK